jgi:predicted anti-sigma-YlaC factor YlaD
MLARERSLKTVLKCRDVSELATDYMGRALPVRVWLGVRVHLFLCSMCRAYIDQLRRTAALLHGRALPPPPPEVEAHLAQGRE